MQDAVSRAQMRERLIQQLLKLQTNKGAKAALPKPVSAERQRVYCFSYDLHDDGDYEGLIAALKGAGAVHVQLSTWLLTSGKTAEGLFQQYSKHLKKGEGCLVFEVTYNHFGRSSEATWQWLAKQMQ